MKADKYTFVFIPDAESGASSYHLSKKVFLGIIFTFLLLLISSLGVMSFYIPKISDYYDLKNSHNKILSERSKILGLTGDLERIKKMDELVRQALGATLEIDDRPIQKDSLAGIFESIANRASNIENIPSELPVKGYLTRTSTESGFFLNSKHNGIDIAAKEGEPILAAATGVVVFSGWTYENGNMIILYHGDGYFTHYGHNKINFLEQLDMVNVGDVIGLVGDTGVSTGPHLHFEVWKEFTPLDPLAFFPEYKTIDLESYIEQN